jgi:hypothetical protein
MTYTDRVFASIRDVPLDDWNTVGDIAGDRFTEPPFIELVENTLHSLTQIVHVETTSSRRSSMPHHGRHHGVE